MTRAQHTQQFADCRINCRLQWCRKGALTQAMVHSRRPELKKFTDAEFSVKVGATYASDTGCALGAWVYCSHGHITPTGGPRRHDPTPFPAYRDHNNCCCANGRQSHFIVFMPHCRGREAYVAAPPRPDASSKRAPVLVQIGLLLVRLALQAQANSA